MPVLTKSHTLHAVTVSVDYKSFHEARQKPYIQCYSKLIIQKTSNFQVVDGEQDIKNLCQEFPLSQTFSIP